MQENWWVAAVGMLPGAGSFAWVGWRWWFDRADKRRDASLSREERLQRELETDRTALSKEQAELFDRLRSELERTEAGRSEAEREAEKWAWLARWWHRFNHDLFPSHCRLAHDLRGLQQWMVWVKASYPDLDLPQTGKVPRDEEPLRGVEDPMKLGPFWSQGLSSATTIGSVQPEGRAMGEDGAVLPRQANQPWTDGE